MTAKPKSKHAGNNGGIRLQALKHQIGGNHYTSMTIQPAEFILANGIGKYEGDVIQYVTRWRSKGGIEDLKKAQQSIQIIIDYHQATVPDEHTKAVEAAEQAQKEARQDAQLQQAKR